VSALSSSPRLRRILAAYTVNQLGTWFGTVALSVAVYDHTHSAIAVTALFIARFLPALAVPALVARVESSPRRGRLSVIYAVESASAAALAGLVWHFWLPAILVLVALDGAGALAASALLRAEAARPEPQDAPGAALRAAAAASASSAEGAPVEPHEVPHAADVHEPEQTAGGAHGANAALNLALSICVVVGPLLAAVAVEAFGVPTAMLIDAASFLVAGALLIDLNPYVEERTGTSVRARLGAAWAHLREAPALRTLLLTEAAALIFFETGAPAEVLYAKGTLKAGDLGYGRLLSAWGVGMVIGSILFARASRRSLGAMLTGGTFAVGLAYLGFAAAPSLGFAALAAVLGGIGNGVQWASLIGTVQRLTPQHLHGRLMGTVESMGALCPLIGLPLSGLVLALGSPRIAFLVFGLAGTAATVGFLRLWMGWGVRGGGGSLLAGLRAAQTPEGERASPAEGQAESGAAAPSGEALARSAALEHSGTSGRGL
jgi:MFS family permease